MSPPPSSPDVPPCDPPGPEALPPGVTFRLAHVRHGEPEARAHGRCYGKLDVGLSARGRAQVQAARPGLGAVPIAAVYASPRIRAVQSARALFDPPVPVEVDPRWAEIDFGAFEGQRYEDIERRYPDHYRRWMEHPTRVRFPEGESFGDMQRRVLHALDELRARHRHQAVTVVSHGGVGRIVAAHALGMDDEHLFRLGQDYANVTVVDYYDQSPVLRRLNWTPRPGAPG